MNEELKIYLENLVIDELMNIRVGSKLKEAIHIIENIQNHLIAINDKKDEKGELTIKIGTIITFAILSKFINGTSPSKLNKQDWKDIAQDVSKYAIVGEDEDYTILIFNLYENYIRYSANQISTFVSEDITNNIMGLADQLQLNTERLKSNEISEVTYIEANLWICLEAMVKLIASFPTQYIGKEFGDLSLALGNYAFEYGRFVLFNKEQALINEFLQEQSQMNDSLKEKYELFIIELQQESEKFISLINNAFNGNFKNRFNATIQLSLEAGVNEKEVLQSIDDIDSFFLD